MAEKRKDKARTVLKTGEVQRKNGTYQYSWMDGQLKRRFIYAKTLADLREKEKNILKDKCDGIKTEARYTTVNDLFDLWLNLKRGLKNNTLENYKYLYNTFVRPVIGNKRVSTLRKSDVKKYYNYLADERNLKVSTIDSIHTVLHQILNKAIRRIIRDCNDEQFEKSEEPEVLLPHFSCHSLRHTFTTRMCEAGVNIKVIQDALGHTDISTTLNIYTDVTKELKTSEFKGLDNYFKAQ